MNTHFLLSPVPEEITAELQTLAEAAGTESSKRPRPAKAAETGSSKRPKTAKQPALAERSTDQMREDPLLNALLFFRESVLTEISSKPRSGRPPKPIPKKRASKKKLEKGKKLYELNKKLILEIDNKFDVEKELLIALMGIETNYGTYLGKMDIISSLATLSFDERRSEFFTNELITILKLIDKKTIDHKILYGSWAGAFGNFQFMPSTIKNYAIDFDNDKKISLKKTDDSFASAANYLNKMGWSNSKPCFYKVELKSNIPHKYLNISAKNIHSTKKVNYLKKYIENNDILNNYDNLNSAIITPDAEIVENPDMLSPAYIIFDNYKLILKWNRSLRFALAVCTLRDKFKNEL